MTISLIVAMGENHVIGRNGDLPWHIPEDLKWFKKNTLGKPIIMGRKTFETLKKPLPGRHNIVITSDQNYEVDGTTVTHSLEEALEAAGEVEEIMICGGASIYKQALPLVDKMYITLIYHDFEGDTFFPKYDTKQWKEVEQIDRYQTHDEYDYSFLIYERRS